MSAGLLLIKAELLLIKAGLPLKRARLPLRKARLIARTRSPLRIGPALQPRKRPGQTCALLSTRRYRRRLRSSNRFAPNSTRPRWRSRRFSAPIIAEDRKASVHAALPP